MRFFGAPGVLLALGVSAVAGHTYHAFEHDYQPVVSYASLPQHEEFIHDSQIATPYEDISDIPQLHDDFHSNQGFVTYLKPRGDHIDLENIDDHSHHELYDFGHHDHHEHEGNYVLHDDHEDIVKDSHEKEHGHHENHDHHQHHEHHENYVLHDDHEHQAKHDHQEEHKHHGNLDHHEHTGNYVHHDSHVHHGNHDDKEEHEQHEKYEELDHGHNVKHKSEAKYEFKYGVNDPKTGDVKQQWETRAGDKVKGGYSLKDADGTTRVVNYSADKKKGFTATVQKIGNPNEKHSEHGYHDH